MLGCVLVLVVVGRDSGYNDTALFHYCRSGCRCWSDNSNSSNHLIAFNRTKKKNRSNSLRDRRSVHDSVLIAVIVFLKTNAVGRCSTTTSAAGVVTQSCPWSFVAMVGVVVAVALGEFVIVSDSSVLLSFRSVLILSSVCTSSVWNPVERIFHGSARDVGRYPCLSRHNQAPSTTTTTSMPITTRREHHDSLGASSPSTSLRPSLSRTLCRLSLALYRYLLHQPGTLPDHQSVCVIPDVHLKRIV